MKLFKQKSTEQQLREKTMEVVTIVVPVKLKVYHEVVEQQDGSFLFKVYNRATSEIVDFGVTKTLKEAQEAALATIKKLG